jgi:hypothetical protein
MSTKAEPRAGGPTTYTLTIPANQTFSNGVSIPKGSAPVLLVMPTGWDPAVLLTIQVSLDNTTYIDVMNSDGSPLSTVVHPGTSLLLQNQEVWAPWLKLRSGTREFPVPQSADRVFQLWTNP